MAFSSDRANIGDGRCMIDESEIGKAGWLYETQWLFLRQGIGLLTT